MVIKFSDIRNTENGRFKALFIENFGLYGRTTIKELLRANSEQRWNLSSVIHKHFGLSGIAQEFHYDTCKLKLWAKFIKGRPVKVIKYNRKGSVIREEPKLF